MEACGGGGRARERDFPSGSLTSMRCSSPHTNSTLSSPSPLLQPLDDGLTMTKSICPSMPRGICISTCMCSSELNALACLPSVCVCVLLRPLCPPPCAVCRLTRTFELFVDVYLWASHAEAADCRYPVAVTKLPINLPTWAARTGL